MLNEWRIDPGTSRPNPNEMVDFNVFTMNSKAFPGTAPLVVRLGDRVKIRLGNLSAMDHHPIHLHGYQFKITETDGGQIPSRPSRWRPPSWCRLAARGPLSSWPMRQAIGPCTAT